MNLHMYYFMSHESMAINMHDVLIFIKEFTFLINVIDPPKVLHLQF